MRVRQDPLCARALIAVLGLGTAIALLLTGCTSTPSSTAAASASSGLPASGSPSSAPGLQIATSGDNSSESSETGTAAGTSGSPSTASVSTMSVPARTTPVPAPGGGDISQTVAAAPVTTQSKVALTAPATFVKGVTARIIAIKPIDTKADGPGEIGGPGIAVTVEIENTSPDKLKLDSVYVTTADSAGSIAIPISSDPAKPFSGQVAPGTKAQAVYVFTVAKAKRNPIAVQVSYSTEAPIVLFVGDAG